MRKYAALFSRTRECWSVIYVDTDKDETQFFMYLDEIDKDTAVEVVSALNARGVTNPFHQ